MFVIMGASGHVGAEVANVLTGQGHDIIAVTHDPQQAGRWRSAGRNAAVADVNDPESLRAVFRQGRRAFLLNPPAPVGQDTDTAERESVACILNALALCGLEKVVAASTGGARPGERLGDLNVLWELEEGLRRGPIPAAFNRAGFYMSNWDGQLEAIRETGTLTSFFPADLRLPMVAPRDLGEAAARRLLSSVDDTGVMYVEGPERYSANDVAAAFAEALQRQVRVEVVPRDQWVDTFRSLGFSRPAAESYARMTGISLDSLDMPDDAIRGRITIDAYIRELVDREMPAAP
ncbi:NmrA family NAD(P)-binding protein [Massilia sp. METH4]|uniref:NmrA family NAD(P)-binding protein n=1 Tax=Massilia sp. METH4 TaxID=3123041 RepID=UPI0030CB2BCC